MRSSYTSNFNMSDKKLDMILDQLKALGPMQTMLKDLMDSVSSVKEDMKSLQHEVNIHEDRIAALERDMRTQKDLSNQQQQQLRSLTVRLLNLPVIPGEKDDNNNGLKNRVYERFLKPLLAAAKASKALPTLPQVGSVIKACFRPFNATADSTIPPPIIIKLASRPIKLALLKHRKELPKPSAEETAAGIKKFVLVEDLTQDTHKTFVALSKSTKTGKVWTHDGNIRYVRVGQSAVHTVKSVYEPVQKILSFSD